MFYHKFCRLETSFVHKVFSATNMDSSSSSKCSFSFNASENMTKHEDKNTDMFDGPDSTSLQEHQLFPQLFDVDDIFLEIDCNFTNENSTDLSQVYVEGSDLLSLDDILDDLNNAQSTSSSSNSMASVENDISNEKKHRLANGTSCKNNVITEGMKCFDKLIIIIVFHNIAAYTLK